MTSLDRRVGPSAQHVRRTNPRAARTRANVIAAARQLIAEIGVQELSYTAVAKRSGVTRQTVYRHWPHRELLLRDIMLEGPDNYADNRARVTTDSVRAILIDFALGYAHRMALRENADPILELMRRADEDPRADEQLAALVSTRLQQLNEQLAHTAFSVDGTGLSLLLGPITSRRFVNRGPITPDFVELAVDRFLGLACPQPGIRVRDQSRPAAKV